jgi:hypothetical protein
MVGNWPIVLADEDLGWINYRGSIAVDLGDTVAPGRGIALAIDEGRATVTAGDGGASVTGEDVVSVGKGGHCGCVLGEKWKKKKYEIEAAALKAGSLLLLVILMAGRCKIKEETDEENGQ